RRHKATGQAVVTINGKDIYLGKFDSAKSRAEYNRIIAEWTANQGTLPRQQTSDLTIAELCAAFFRHAQPRRHAPSRGAKTYFSDPPGYTRPFASKPATKQRRVKNCCITNGAIAV